MKRPEVTSYVLTLKLEYLIFYVGPFWPVQGVNYLRYDIPKISYGIWTLYPGNKTLWFWMSLLVLSILILKRVSTVYLYTSHGEATQRSHARSALSCLHLFEKLGGHQRNEQNDNVIIPILRTSGMLLQLKNIKILKNMKWGNHRTIW